MAINRRTLRLLRQLRVTVGEEADQATRGLTRAWVRAWDELAAGWRAGIGDAVAWSMANGRWPQPWEIARLGRLMAALQRSEQALAQLGTRTGVLVTDGAGRIITATAQAEPAIIASQLPAAMRAEAAARYAARILPQALDVIVARTAGQITATTRPLAPQATEVMRRELIRGIAVGDNPRTVARAMVARVQGAFEGGLTRAMVISRTEQVDAYRTASRYAHAANADVLTGWTWAASLDKRTCPACWAMHGTLHPIEEPGPLGHQQCIAPGAIVEGPRPVASTARWYAGEVVDIETDGGHFLSVTPNHPVLTPSGWVAAGELHEGSDVVCGSGRQRGLAVNHPDDYQVPALIEDVAQALGGASSVVAVSVPTASEDFHGDGAGSEVHVVRTDGLLRDGLNTPFAKPVGELSFCVRHVGLATLTRDRTLDLPFDGYRNPAGSGLCREHQSAVLLRSSLAGQESVGLRLVAALDPGVAQSSFDESTRHAVALRQSVFGLASEVAGDHFVDWDGVMPDQRGRTSSGPQSVCLLFRSQQATFDEDGTETGLARTMPSRSVLAAYAGEIVVDRVLKLTRRGWQGHVYNLQTTEGWYLANGVVTHNCRCARLPKTKSWKELGIPLDEPADLTPDARARFDALPKAAQLEIMGPARLELLRSGQVNWSDLAVRRSTPAWRDSYAPTPVRDLQRLADQRVAA